MPPPYGYLAKTIVAQGFEFVNKNKRQYRRLFFLEASPRLELGVRILQTLALPLGYEAIRAFNMYIVLERETGFGPATFTLAR